VHSTIYCEVIYLNSAANILFSKHFAGKVKADAVSNILTRVSTIYNEASQMDLVQRVCDHLSLPDPAPLHNLYGDLFNLVDLADRYHYAVNDTHHNQCWRSKLVFGLLRFVTLDTWVMTSRTHYEPWIQFRGNLASKLLEYQDD